MLCIHLSLFLRLVKIVDVHRSMARIRNLKKPDHRYFDVKRVTDLDAVGQPFKGFLSSYAQYVFYRTKTFSKRFAPFLLPEELASMSGPPFS